MTNSSLFIEVIILTLNSSCRAVTFPSTFKRQSLVQIKKITVCFRLSRPSIIPFKVAWICLNYAYPKDWSLLFCNKDGEQNCHKRTKSGNQIDILEVMSGSILDFTPYMMNWRTKIRLFVDFTQEDLAFMWRNRVVVHTMCSEGKQMTTDLKKWKRSSMCFNGDHLAWVRTISSSSVSSPHIAMLL